MFGYTVGPQGSLGSMWGPDGLMGHHHASHGLHGVSMGLVHFRAQHVYLLETIDVLKGDGGDMYNIKHQHP